MRRLWLFTALGLALIIWFVLVKPVEAPDTASNNAVALQQFEDQTHAIKISYPKSAVVSELTDKDKSDRFILIANATGDKPYKIYLKYEDGLRAATALTKLSVLDFMLENLNKSYPRQFPAYSKLSEHRLQLNGKEAAEVIFTYSASTGEVVKQQIVLVTKDNNKAFYLSMQAKETDFEALKETFQRVKQSVNVE